MLIYFPLHCEHPDSTRDDPRLGGGAILLWHPSARVGPWMGDFLGVVPDLLMKLQKPGIGAEGCGSDQNTEENIGKKRT